MITNSGELRFDVFSGSFDRNDQFTASPFTDTFLFIPNVTSGVANKVLPALNNQGAEEKRAILDGRERELWRKGFVDARYKEWLRGMAELEGAKMKRQAENLTLGYVTSDVRLNMLCSDFPTGHSLSFNFRHVQASAMISSTRLFLSSTLQTSSARTHRM